MKFTGTNTGGNSRIFDNGTNIGIGTTTPTFPVTITGANAARNVDIQNSNAAGDAIWGMNSAAAGTGPGAGLVGITSQASATAAGLVGENRNPNGTGVVGLGNAQSPTTLPTGAGGAFHGSTTGVFARSTNSQIGQAVYSDKNGSVVRTAYFDGATFFKINGTGTVSTNVADVTDPAGERRVTLYAPESPEILFQDFGEGQLQNGRAFVALDPRFAGAVTIDDNHPLRVFVELEDDEHAVGVVVKNKSSKGFEVVERMGGTSNARFQWQVVANRRDEVLPSGRVSRNADVRFGVHAPNEHVLEAPARSASDDVASTTPAELPVAHAASAAATPAPHAGEALPAAGDPLADESDDAELASAGCSASSSAGGLLALLGLLLLRRRK